MQMTGIKWKAALYVFERLRPCWVPTFPVRTQAGPVSQSQCQLWLKKTVKGKISHARSQGQKGQALGAERAPLQCPPGDLGVLSAGRCLRVLEVVRGARGRAGHPPFPSTASRGRGAGPRSEAETGTLPAEPWALSPGP